MNRFKRIKGRAAWTAGMLSFLLLVSACGQTEPPVSTPASSGETGGTSVSSGTATAAAASGRTQTAAASASAQTDRPASTRTSSASTRPPVSLADSSWEAYIADMYLNVRDYGAVGDGKTDDTRAIQRAVNSATGGTVYFPAGTYRITAPIQIATQTNLLGQAGDGVGGSVILAGGSMSSLFTSLTFDAYQMAIGNLTFDGGASSGCKVSWAMELYNCRSTKVFNCRFTNLSGGGINLDENEAGYLWINHFDCLQFDRLNDYAIRAIVSDSFFSEITIDGGKGILDFNYGGNCYSNILVQNSTGNGITIGREELAEVGNVTFKNCTFRNNAGYGLSLSSPAGRTYGKQATVQSCDFSGNGEADIGADNSALITVYNTSLRSKVPIYCEKASALGFIDLLVGASALDTGKAANVYLSGVKTGVSSFPTAGYHADSDTDFPYYQEVYTILGGSSAYSYVNVEDFGSPDGRDWGGVIQKAIDSLPAAGGVVYFPDSYTIGTQVTVPSNVYLVGHGQVKKELFQPAGTMEGMFLVEGTGSGFINCAFSGSSTGSCTTAGIVMQGAENCFFYNCSLNAGSGMPYALSIAEDCSGIYLNTGSLGSADADKAVVLCSGSHCVIQNQYASGGPSLILKGGRNNVMQSNHFEVCAYTHITLQNQGNGTMGHVITSNYFDVNDCCVRFRFSSAVDCGVTISCNSFRTDAREKDEATGLNPPELVLTSVKNVRIIANTFQQGLSIRTEGIACSQSAFTSNMISTKGNDLFTGDSKALGADCTVEGNLHP